jgi:hypothetical protein
MLESLDQLGKLGWEVIEEDFNKILDAFIPSLHTSCI